MKLRGAGRRDESLFYRLFLFVDKSELEIGIMKATPAAQQNQPESTDLENSTRLIGRVVSMRPIGPGIIATPGNRPDRFVFSTSLVPNVEWGCLVTFTPRPPRAPDLPCGVAVDVVVALPASEVPPAPKKKPQTAPTKISERQRRA